MKRGERLLRSCGRACPAGRRMNFAAGLSVLPDSGVNGMPEQQKERKG